MEKETGTLVRWNEEKGFGFIKPHSENHQDVFIHISALKQMARKPIMGDEIRFFREQQSDGKVKAIKASIEGVAIVASTNFSSRRNHSHQKHTKQNQPSYHNKAKSKSSSSAVVRFTSAIIIVSVFSFGFTQYQKMNAAPTKLDNKAASSLFIDAPTPVFRCETGKAHCNQMRSCEEAMFYIQHCPGTKMDGDGDGIPCERQHCR